MEILKLLLRSEIIQVFFSKQLFFGSIVMQLSNLVRKEQNSQLHYNNFDNGMNIYIFCLI